MRFSAVSSVPAVSTKAIPATAFSVIASASQNNGWSSTTSAVAILPVSFPVAFIAARLA
ncbi:hypothetical protein GALL_467430 [mine drainage metagenome]|uniref:Uncharacterized protein n=1 Tax=mine drainage metagenome TaxID=410659 RepID=A0A1J5PV60_9ZZZZ